MRNPAQTFHIPALAQKPQKWLWDRLAPQVVQDSEDLKANKVNRVQRDQKALEEKQALQDLRDRLGPKDPAVCLFKACLECQVKKEIKETVAFLVPRESQEVWAHQDVMAHQARGDFLERMVPLAPQDHQGQLEFLEPPVSRGSRAAWDHKVPWGHLVFLEQRASGVNEETCSLKPW